MRPQEHSRCSNGRHTSVQLPNHSNKLRPTPLATVEMQRDASRLLRISSDQCMALAESLYQRGYLSYPRTETDGFKDGFYGMMLMSSTHHRFAGLFTIRKPGVLPVTQFLVRGSPA